MNPKILRILMVGRLTTGVMMCFVAPSLPADTTPLPEDHGSSVGYATVDAALTALRAKPGAHVELQQGWTIIEDSESGGPVFWSFAPPGHPAYPSAVKRYFLEANGASFIEMKVLCQASKEPCDALVREFQALNERLSAYARNASTPSSDTPAAGSGTHEEINLTSDSAPGWVPSAQQRAEVPRAIHAFLAALDAGQHEQAYRLMTAGQQTVQPLDAFAKRIREFNAVAGPVRERRIVKVTWTKVPADSPAPGIYAAVDLVGRFANIDRHCGYLILYQSEAQSPFLVTRQEDNYLSNDQAQRIERQHSHQAVDEAWSQLARNCPNYSGAH